MRLKGKVALVSGAAGGIGAAVVRRFVAEGAVVGLADVDLHGVREIARTLDGGAALHCIAVDVTRAADWERAVAGLVDAAGGVDILINNAGIYQRQALEQISEQDWDRVMAVNAKGPWLGAKAVLPAMRARGGGAIVNVSSTAGIRVPRWPPTTVRRRARCA